MIFLLLIEHKLKVEKYLLFEFYYYNNNNNKRKNE